MNRLRLIIAALCVLVVVLSTSVAFAEPLSEQQWRKQANVICNQSNQDFNAIYDEGLAGLGPNDVPTPEQLAVVAQRAGPALEQTIASINALNEPKALKQKVKKLTAAADEVVATLEADPSSAISESLYVKASKVAKRLGIVCGN